MSAHIGRPFQSHIVCLILFLACTTGAIAQAPARSPGPIDNAKRGTLKGNVHAMARAEFDGGAAAPDLMMARMLLVMKRSPEQAAQLAKLLGAQQDKTSAQYRKW